MKTLTKRDHRKSQQKSRNTVFPKIRIPKFAPIGIGSFKNYRDERDLHALVFLYGESD